MFSTPLAVNYFLTLDGSGILCFLLHYVSLRNLSDIIGKSYIFIVLSLL